MAIPAPIPLIPPIPWVSASAYFPDQSRRRCFSVVSMRTTAPQAVFSHTKDCSCSTPRRRPSLAAFARTSDGLWCQAMVRTLSYPPITRCEKNFKLARFVLTVVAGQSIVFNGLLSVPIHPNCAEEWILTNICYIALKKGGGGAGAAEARALQPKP